MKSTHIPSSDSLYQGITGGFFATISYLIGGIDNLMITFAIFMALDYFTGALAGWYTSKLSSDRAFRGLAKKAGMMSFAIVATQLDYTFGSGDGFLRGAVLMILIGTEGISIMENCARLGLKIPKFLYDRLEQLQSGEGGSSGTVEIVSKEKIEEKLKEESKENE
jgi:toxin secretion/phage lysis holin